VAQAIEIFKLNVSLYPQSWNVYDSLAEAYENVGDKSSAVKNYERSLAMNPKNDHAVERLKALGTNGAGVK
jgi:D-alanyl-D-alanine-carboxypeptidase/D-alanyl-D-alanine-endopeptidase